MTSDAVAGKDECNMFYFRIFPPVYGSFTTGTGRTQMLRKETELL